jgi:hypothetical protein
VTRVDGADPDLDDALRLAALHVRDPAPRGYDGLDALLSVCVDTVPGAEAAAISHAGDHRVRSTHCTDLAIAEVDAWHGRLGYGPLLGAARAGPPPLAVLVVDDLASGVGEPVVGVRFPPPFRALHSTTLHCGEGRRTALDLYATVPDVLGPDTTVLADMFARRAITLLHESDVARPRAVDRLDARRDPP